MPKLPQNFENLYKFELITLLRQLYDNDENKLKAIKYLGLRSKRELVSLIEERVKEEMEREAREDALLNASSATQGQVPCPPHNSS